MSISLTDSNGDAILMKMPTDTCIYVTPFEQPYGNDDMVVNMARVSFSKTASMYTQEQNAKLIRYLAKHNHWSPFAAPKMGFRVTAPIFIARQLLKHMVGMDRQGEDYDVQAWNEESRRYLDAEVETILYSPVWRNRPDGSIKQGSGDPVGTYERTVASEIFFDAADRAYTGYHKLCALGIAPEQARAILPLATYTSWVWVGSLAAWARVVNQRIDPHAQKEAQEFATKVDRQMRELFPISWEALRTNDD